MSIFYAEVAVGRSVFFNITVLFSDLLYFIQCYYANKINCFIRNLFYNVEIKPDLPNHTQKSNPYIFDPRRCIEHASSNKPNKTYVFSYSKLHKHLLILPS